MIRDEIITPEQIGIIDEEDLAPAHTEWFVADLIATLLRHKEFIGITTLLLTAAAALVLYRLPPSYKADAIIMPPQEQQSTLSTLMAGALGGMATGGMASQLGLKSASDLYIGILKSRTIADDIVERFHLREVYHSKLQSDACKALEAHATFTTGKDTLIKISVKDHDPRLAAALANAFIDELYKQNSRLAVTDASQRRLFFEQELEKEKNALANAEIALKSTQQSTGLVVPTGQAEVLVRTAAELRAQIVSRQVELEATRSYATDENPEVQILKKEIAELQNQLKEFEARDAFGSKFEVSATRLPEATLEYIRRVRDLRYHETLYELLARQYEASRIDEAKQAPVIQVVDPAVVPDKDSRPRLFLAALAGVVAFAFSIASVLLVERLRVLASELSSARLGLMPAEP